MKMTKKFENLNDTFNTEDSAEIVVSADSSEVDIKIEKMSSSVDDVKKDYE